MKHTLRMITVLALVLALCCVTAAAAGTETSQSGGSDRPAASQDAMTPPQGDGQPGNDLQVLVEQGIISQDTLDAILKFMEENRPELPEGDNNQNGAQPGNAPEKPDGQQPGNAPEMPNGQQPGNAPQMPDGQQPSGMPEAPNAGGQQMFTLNQELLNQLLEANVITEDEYDAILAFQPSMPSEGPGGNPPAGGPGGSASSVTYTAATEISSADTLTDGIYLSDSADENAILIDTDETVTLTNATVTKSGDSDGGDSCNFYGLNAAVLAKGGAEVNIVGGTVTSDASGANGVFSYGGNGGQNGAVGDGTTVNISDTVITTTGDGSGGIMTTGGGITNATNLTVTTSGRSSAAIRTDRGGGTVNVDGGTYTSNGLGSPAIYSTAAITVSNATLASNLSEGVCIEGMNTITLTDCDLTANNTQCNGNATFLDTIMIYQSMSGDADSGTSAFTMTGGRLTSKNGHVFHVTNTHAVITLNDVKITNGDSEQVLLSVCDDGWSGAENNAELYASAQTLEGAILVGSNSQLTLTLSGGSSFTGSISGSITNSKGSVISTEVGTVSLTLDDTSTWTLTGDSYITSFTGDASQIISNGYTLYVNGVALEGTK